MLIFGALLPNQSYEWIQPVLGYAAIVFLFRILFSRREVVGDIVDGLQADEDEADEEQVKKETKEAGEWRRMEEGWMALFFDLEWCGVTKDHYHFFNNINITCNSIHSINLGISGLYEVCNWKNEWQT